MLSIQAADARARSWSDASFDTPHFSRDPSRGEAAAAPVVHIVDLDNDAQILSGWVRAAGLAACNYAVVDEFVDRPGRDTLSCLVVDARIARGSSADFSSFVGGLGACCPIVMTAYDADIPTAVLAMKTGVIDFVEKPFRENDILGAIEAALRMDGERRRVAERGAELGKRFAALSPRERQVMALVTTGLLNKQVAGELGVSEITVKAHRGQAMRKMGARSVADLVRMADALCDTTPAPTGRA